MAKQVIGLGTVPNDGTGDALRTAFDKTNDNFDELYFSGALVKKAADQTAANYTTDTAVTWDAEEYDTGGWHDNVTNSERLTVPAGVTRVRVVGQVRLTSMTADEWVQLYIRKNGSAAYAGIPYHMAEIGTSTPALQVVTPPLVVVAGDYFDLVLAVEADTSITLQASRSWFSIERLPG